MQIFGARRTLQAATTTVLAWDYRAKRTVATSVPTVAAFGGPNAPRLEAYDPTSPYTYPSTTQADRAAVLNQQALEVRHKTWLGRGTVRTFSAGTTFLLTQSLLDDLPGLSALPDSGGESGPAGDAARTFLLWLTTITLAG